MPTNPILTLIDQRRSVRTYAPEPLTPDEENAILHAAMRAPTAGNMQLYTILRIENQSLKDRLAQTCDNQPFIARAPFVLVFLADYQRWWDYYNQCGAPDRAVEQGISPRSPQAGDLMLAVCDALIAAQTAVVAAESLGIGSCYIGDILERYETHRDLFDLPRYAVPAAMVCFGRPLHPEERHLSPRFDPEFIVHTDRYRRLDEGELRRMFREREEKFGAPRENAANFGQAQYLRKFVADFSAEMSRSVEAMLASWDDDRSTN